MFGLEDRGVLVPGKRADVNLVDLDTLASTTPELRDDLPGGGSRLVGRGRGYMATMVAGEVIFEDGEHTGRLPGRLARPANA
jgi:N-acyl-D-aspartate/D-glutamate deacylase